MRASLDRQRALEGMVVAALGGDLESLGDLGGRLGGRVGRMGVSEGTTMRGGIGLRALAKGVRNEKGEPSIMDKSSSSANAPKREERRYKLFYR